MKEASRGSLTFLIILLSYVALSLTYAMCINTFHLPKELALFHGAVDLLIPIVMFFVITKLPWKKVMQQETKFSWLTLFWVFLIFIISLPMKVAVSTIAQMFTGADASAVTMMIGSFTNSFMVLFITVAVMPALFEEFIMRGIVLYHYRNIPPFKAAVVTGLLFGILHLELGQLPYTALLGVIMALIVIYTRNIWYGVAFHFLNNFLGVLGLWAISKAQEFGLGDLINQSLEAQAVSSGFSISTLFSSLISLMAFTGLMYLVFNQLKKSVPPKELTDEEQVMQEDPSWTKLLLSPSMITTYVVATILMIVIR